MTTAQRPRRRPTALSTRRSTRGYLPRTIELRQVEAILDEARWAPSGGNMQPWRVIVVAGAERDKVVALAHRWLDAGATDECDGIPVYPDGLPPGYLTRRTEFGREFYRCLGLAKEESAARVKWRRFGYSFFGAPVGVFFLAHRAMGPGQWAHLGMFMQSVALAAARRGVGTCFQEAWAHLRASLHRHFALGPNDIIYSGMALGWPDPAHPANAYKSDRAPVCEFAAFLGFPKPH